MNEWLRTKLPELVEEHGVVGAQVAVLADGEIHDAAAGVLSTVSRAPVTRESLFQIGSITKVWTATLVQELVDEGLLDLDRPVRAVLPEFRLADSRAAEIVTPRQLLCHTGGFEGDQWFDTGTGDDCVEKFVARLADARQLTAPGGLYSYCNAGYVVLGRIVEVLRGKPFHVVLRERLVTPLGLAHVATHYDEYPRHTVTEGHQTVGGEEKPVERRMPGSDAPAGSAFAMNARALLGFVRMHLETTAYDAMRVQQVATPDLGAGAGGWGLGWGLHRYQDGSTGIGHTGATLGCFAYLRVLPETGVAVAVLTNGGAVGEFSRAVFSQLLEPELLPLPVPPATPVPVDSAVVGVYRSSALNIHVTPAPDGRVRVRYEPRNWIAEASMTNGERGVEFTTLNDNVLIAVEAPHPVLAKGDGWLHFGRIAVRASPSEWISQRLPELIAKHGVVGAQLAILVDGEVHDAAAGVLNTATGAPVTSESLFQIASITKVWTATLVQELVDEGLLDLDRPVRDVLPELRLADPHAAEVVTPRQLLCHTGGFEGDLFFDTGTGDDAVAKVVARIVEARQLTAPGELWSYSNAGYTLLGRIVEVLRGKPFNTVLRERLATPLGITVATTLAENAELRAAVGHVDRKPVSNPGPESDWPAGSALAMSARDLLGFVRLHLETPAFDVMREPQVTPPDFGVPRSWGLGWELYDYVGGTVIGHNGGNVGLASNLRIMPESGVAFALLTNGGNAQAVFVDVVEQLFTDLAGVRRREFPVPPTNPEPVDVARVAGAYRCAGYDVHVTPGENGCVLVRFEDRTEPDQEPARECVLLRDDALIAVEEPHTVLALIGRDDQDRVRYLHFGRLAERFTS